MTTVTTGRGRGVTLAERAATFTIFLALGVGVGAWAAALPALKLQLDMSDRGLSLALFGLAIGSVLSSVAAGVIAPRLGTGRATGVASLAVVAALFLPPWAGTLPQFIGLTFVVGLAVGALDVSMNGHAGAIEQRSGGPMMSSFHAAFSLGGLVGSALGGAIAWLGWGTGPQLWIPVALAGACNLLALPWLGRGQKRRGGGLGMAWPRRAMLGLCAIILFCFVIEGAMADWSAVYLSTVAGSSVAVAATAYAAFSITMAAGRFVGDRCVSILGPRWVVVAGGVLALAGLGLAVALPIPLPAAIGFALVGIGLANVAPVVFSAAARSGTSPAAGVATVATVGYAGFLSGPPVIGAIASVAGLRTAIGCLTLAAAVTTLLALTTIKDRSAPGR